MLSFQSEGKGGRSEVDEQEDEEETKQLVEAVRRGSFRMKVLIDEVVQHTGYEHQVDQRGDKWQQYLKDKDIRQGKQAHGTVLRECALMFEDGLQDAE